MKTKSRRALTSLIALGLSVGALPAMADKQAVQQAEKQVSDFVARNGKTNPAYPSQLANLANVYLANGMLKEADETFNKSIELQKSFPNSKSELPQAYTNYAMSLANKSSEKSLSQATRQDLQKQVQTVLKSGLVYANKCPVASSERLYYLFNMIEASRMAGMKTEEQAQMAFLEQELKALESNDKLQPQEIMQIAYTLLRMAGLQCFSPAFRAARMMPPIQVVSDSAPDKPQTVKEKKFK
ncbi:MAG: hypothetical protein IT342_19050, partial [Candidatus Melainabacteria bacterium]|nr:hypothetical protein [Candidatus Melainabacteria bacterium]